MNDINESNRYVLPNFNENILTLPEVEDLCNQKISEYGQISLTEDYENKNGFDIPALWGHYANKGKGVCLVFDKALLLNNLDDNYLYESIRYDDDTSTMSLFGEITENGIVDLDERQLFEKSSDWKYEQEFRIISKAGNTNFLSFGNSLIAVILHSVNFDYSNSLEYKILNKIDPDVPILRYFNSLGTRVLINGPVENCYWSSIENYEIDI